MSDRKKNKNSILTRQGLGSVADIVTDEVRLIEQLIMPLKKMWEGQKET